MKSLLGVALLAASLCFTPQVRAADIVDTAVGAKQFKTLVAAVGAADLVDALKGDGPFTVLAPTDEAFAKLPEGTIETLLKPENKGKLTAILTYHVIPKQVPASTVVTLSEAKTLGGESIQIQADNSGVRINDANVLQTDIACDNGLIHVIDSVLLPPEKAAKPVATSAADIIDTAVAAGSFKTLAAALGAADLVGALKGEGPFTVLAPTDEAFAKLPAGTVESLLKPENKGKLAAILKYHVVAGRVPASTVVTLRGAKTLGGETIRISADSSGVRINDSNVIQTDIECSNGIIHVIDSVLLPPGPSSASSCASQACSSITSAIAEGAPLYNAGHHGACVSVYREALNGLMSTDLDAGMKSHIRTVLHHADRNHNMSDRAWTLRRGMDQMYVTLKNRN
ncbi:MAG: fasciclin domain-containing protein [Planctomycetota bacterium]